MLFVPRLLQAGDYFAINVVDADTGRGVPLVELRTVNSIRYWTDSNGIVAFNEPGLMDREVFFHVQSHGYEYPKDGFNNRGVKLKVTRGGTAKVKIKRLNIAERLYRITGQGIYRDSLLVGRKVPLRQSALNGQVMGQDTVIATRYRGKIYWCWGDTDRPSYPLGNFGASGATSNLPGRGGLDPSTGVDLNYFVDQTGFSKPMCPKAHFGDGLKWIEGLMTLVEKDGRERLLARVAAGTGLTTTRDWHLAIFNDRNEEFESFTRWDIHDTHDSAHPFHVRVGTDDYIYLYPNYRVRGDLQSLRNLAAYEAFTCLAPDTRYERGASKLNRSPDGHLRYSWQPGADRLTGSRMRELIKAGLVKPDEAWMQPHDIETGRPIQTDRGSVCWNEYRRRWVMIASGSPGEVWFAEADTPLGPWVYACRIVSHNQYNFYNPTQHPFFDQHGGRIIYFEGTYTAAFSGAKEKTPRYDYNQIMYRLSLDDSRLALPGPVYGVRQTNGATHWMLRDDIEAAGLWDRIEALPFFAVAPDRRREGLIPIYATIEKGAQRLQATPPPGRLSPRPHFFALPPTKSSTSPNAETANEFNSSAVTGLYEYRRKADGTLLYSTQANMEEAGLERAAEPICRVWRNPMAILILDSEAKPLATVER